MAATAAGGVLMAGGHMAPVDGAAIAVTSFAAATTSEPRTGATGADDRAAAPLKPIVAEPAIATADGLVKAVTLVEEQRAEAERKAEQEAARSCAAGTSGFGDVMSWVADAGEELRCRFGVDTVYGVAGRAGTSDHPGGLALVLMVDRDPGVALAEYAVDNMDRLDIEYVIYRQRINFGSGWEAMEDRGGATANHTDHVHVSFDER